ncbi:unnamed protein product [Phytophthora fragariaefolia]|uniref:Unnamed protein product n=1 Tax=Phytophthora fragariaefolia TaxID=1490495 RepID=A0A9W6TUM6_9STRA|nr:unnamed protein product [Phytophthora fragariaefolia]
MATRFKVLGEFLSDEEKLPALGDCKLGNGDQRSYPLDLPDDPTVDVPRSPIPSNEADRIEAGKTSGLLQLADLLAPEKPLTDLSVPKPDTHDLQLLCCLAVKALGCAYSFVTVMCSKHEHVPPERWFLHSLANSKPGDEELTVGMLCCVDSKPRAEITRMQYGTMKRLASTAKHFLLQKSRQLQLER